MKTTHLPFWGFVLAGAFIGAGARGADLQVTVAGLANARGHVVCGLFDAAPGFPNAAERAIQRVTVPANPPEVRCTFRDVAPGSYAVAVFHDENDDGVLDTNFIGVPREGYGVSNNHAYALHAPSFEESRFTLAPGAAAGLRVLLRY